jgi:hypothetical protein
MPTEDRSREAIDTFITRVRQDLDVHLRELTSELAKGVEEHHETVRAQLTRDMERRPGNEAANGSGDGVAGAFERLIGGVRRLDEATTLTVILETLAEGAAADASRVAILLVEGEVLRTWGHFGFAPSAAPIEVPMSQARVITAAVALRQMSFVQPSTDERDWSVPAFMRLPAGHTGIVVPIVVGAEVVAVLYADDVGRTPNGEGTPVWMEAVEMLVRHASSRLENVTSLQTVELFTKPG